MRKITDIRSKYLKNYPKEPSEESTPKPVKVPPEIERSIMDRERQARPTARRLAPEEIAPPA